VELLERGRYQEAAIGSSELARTAADVAFARTEIARASRNVADVRATLAGVLAVPPAALRGVELTSAPVAGCAWADSLGGDSVAALAVTRRAEVAHALAEYAAAEARVRSEVARQRPDLELGPGFVWDQGVHRWSLLFALPALLGFRNRAAIEAAESARSAAAVRVREAQEEVLAQAAEAVEHCRGVSDELAVADSIGATTERLSALARGAYERGETGRLELARAELALLRARSAGREVRRRLEGAGLALEAVTAEWRGVEPAAWPDPRTPSDSIPEFVP
jgi:outer membrane protein, heavy metal efflux system